MTLRRLAPAVLAALVALPAVPAQAAPAPAGPPVEVVALVERPDGTLAVRRSTVDSRDQARALVAAVRRERGVVAADVPVPVRAANVPSPDPHQHLQWGLGATRADRAWELGDAAGQVVAVLDTGVDTDHPDLVGALAPGRDFIDGDTVPQDGNGHGTHVAGVAAGVAGNGQGIAGTALRGKIMPVRVLEADGSGSSATVTEALLWAVDNGATVVNLSLGGPARDTTLERAIGYALDKGVTVVAAAGNSGLHGDPVNYPAASPGVLAVGAVDRGLVRPGFSSTGDHLALVAPGVDIASTVPGNRYAYMTGTSMAAPGVSAAAAMLRAAAARAGAPLSADALRTLLTSTARDLGPSGHDAQYGAGLLDIYGARQAQTAALQPAPAKTEPEPQPEPQTQPEPEPEPEPQPDPEPKLRDLSQACPSGSVPDTQLSDLSGNVHRLAVECLVWWSVARGTSTTTYSPSAAVTRAQMATFIANTVLRSGGTLPEPDLARFSDDDASTHATSIGRLAAAGIVQGTSATSYGPDLPVTRAQMATFLVRAYEYRAGRVLPVPATTFPDVPPGAHADSIAKATGAGFTAGTADGTFRPGGLVTRDQMGSFVARELDRLVEADGAQPPA